MLKRVVVKQKTSSPELTDMFNQMVGTSMPDPSIIAPKYETLISCLETITVKIRQMFTCAQYLPAGIMDEFGDSIRELIEFCNQGESEIASVKIARKDSLLGNDLTLLNQDPSLIMEFITSLHKGYNPEELAEAYKSAKDLPLTNAIIIAVRDIRKIVEEYKSQTKSEHHCLELRSKLSDMFIKKHDDAHLPLMPSITALDFKQVWMHEAADYNVKKRFIYGLYIILSSGSEIVELIMSPDIDIDKFSEVLIENISKLKKQIPRCEKAFSRIAESVSMLKTNFSEYYKDFVTAKNPSIIVENFILDVAQNDSTDIDTMVQFRTIINYYKKLLAQQPKNKVDPNISKIFDMLEENMSELEKKVGKDEEAQD